MYQIPASGSATANTATVQQVNEEIPVALTTDLVSVLVDPASTPSGVPLLPPLLVDGKLCSDANPFSSNTVDEEGIYSLESTKDEGRGGSQIVGKP